MKIRQNFILAYIFPLIFALLFFISGIVGSASGQGAGILGMSIFVCLIIVVLCVVDYFTTTLEIKDGFLVGHTGLIKKRTLSSPLSKIQYCEYITFLCFNKININCISGQYTFKNMSKAKQFVELVHSSVNN